MENWTLQERAEEEVALVGYLINKVTGKASGRLEDYCFFDMPHDRYFIGNLRSSEGIPADQSTLLQRELMKKISPLAFGAEFLLSPEQLHVRGKVILDWACYYRVFPTFDEHSRLQKIERAGIINESKQSIDDDEIHNGETIDSSEDPDIALEVKDTTSKEQRLPKRERHQRDILCPKFRKINCHAEGEIIIDRSGSSKSIDCSTLLQACAAEISRARLQVINDPDAIKTSGDIDSQIKVPEESFTSKENFLDAICNFATSIIPDWEWSVLVDINTGNQGDVCSFVFENTSPMPNQSNTRESYFFDVVATIIFAKGDVKPTELELAPKGFRYDRMVWGRGFNCEITKVDDVTYKTTHTPLHIQQRYESRVKPEAQFEKLAHDPIPTLQKILEAMQAYLGEWDVAEAKYQSQYGGEWEKFRIEFFNDREKFKSEIECFSQGLKLIQAVSDINLAFRLTNETFFRAGQNPTKPKTNWRLFQIVFLVTQIPGINALRSSDSLEIAEREKVDIIYFPTGGGKTEAYLGVLVFHCFFDRLRGKKAGVTAWLRFPLRLLTLQQTQRMADIIGIAELVRREQIDPRLSNHVAPFSVGYFVGESSSPNILRPNSDNPEDRVSWSRASDPIERDKWKRVVTCPACHTPTVQVELDENTVRLIHRCTNPSCPFPNGKIPIYIVDNEIYRYLPSVIVGTIDKLAGLGNQRKFSLIFGAVTGTCMKHGYFNGKCCQDECKCEKQWQKGRIPSGLSGPTLFIQDELHLLREGLGTFDGHYETFTQELLSEMNQEGPLKIIASSATIEAFERQVEHLYGRKQGLARVFPSTGPSLEKSFYAETRDYPQRLFLGIIPHNKTIFNAILELLEYFHTEIQSLSLLTAPMPNPYGGRIPTGSPDWVSFIDPYLTTLTYFLKTTDLSSIRTDIETHVNSNLEYAGYKSLTIAELTGSTLTGEVARTLEKIEQPYKLGNPDAILATSMVSHGVDIDRFNFMVFYGMPRQNAEYIQSSSRVGRSHVGLVLVCLHPVRERDQSHYRYFTKYHQFLGQLVEPVAINRWSKFSIERTLPGLFMGILLQLISNNSGDASPGRYYNVETIKKKISTGEITPEQFIPILKKAYRVENPNSPVEQFFCNEIEHRVKIIFDQIVGASPQITFVSEALYPQPMRSLRDVDEAIDIELDDIGNTWISK
jgi:hypothetical protein